MFFRYQNLYTFHQFFLLNPLGNLLGQPLRQPYLFGFAIGAVDVVVAGNGLVHDAAEGFADAGVRAD